MATAPNGVSTAASSGSSNVSLDFRGEATELPGREISFTDNFIYGMPNKIATMTGLFTQVNMSVILSDDYREKLFFEQWQDLALGSYRNGNITDGSFDVGYYSDYVGTVNINCYNEIGIQTYGTVLVDAFPMIIGSTTLSWERGNEIAKLQVGFGFRYYTDVQNQQGQVRNSGTTISTGSSVGNNGGTQTSGHGNSSNLA